MSKRLIVILTLAFVAGIAFAAYAEVQNVKVSGDITIKAVARDNFDLTKTRQIGSVVGSVTFDDPQSDFLSIARVRVDADLTDNVATTVRLLNERNWNGESETAGRRNTNIGLNTGLTTTDENDIDLDLAYVTLKEFLYSSLSLSVGRQELRFGNGLVVGDPDTNIYAVRSNLAQGDLSSRKSFDAIKAVLNYNPLVITGVYAKIDEGNNSLNDDVNLAGINASYELDKNTTLEGFYFSKIRGSQAAAVTSLDNGQTTNFTSGKQKGDKVHTIGARVVNKSVKNLTLDAQGAYQFGLYDPKFDPNARVVAPNVTPTDKAEPGKRRAWAVQTNLSYDLKDVNLISKYSPLIAANYTYFSGADRERTGGGKYKGWDTMFEDQTYGHLLNAIIADTNMHRVALLARAKLTDDIAFSVDWIAAKFAKEFTKDRRVILSAVPGAKSFRMDKGGYIGQEVDAALTYDYTEDVQFSLMGGIFMPSKNIQGNTEISTNMRAKATEVIGSMKVTF